MRIGIDLGGTKIEGVALDDSGGILVRQRVATPAGDCGASLEAVGRLVARIERACRSRGSVGIATPGTLSPARNVIRNANSVCLNGRALVRDIQERPERPVRLANDADCFVAGGLRLGLRIAGALIPRPQKIGEDSVLT